MYRVILCLALSMGSLTAQARADWISTIAASNPLNWYRLDETAGPTAFDYGSQGLHGTYGTGIHAPVLGAAGLVGGAVSFDGNRRNILLNGSDLSGDWSAEFILMKTGTKHSAELLRGVPLASPSTHLKLEQDPNTGLVGYTQSFVADRVFSPAYAAPIGEFVDLVFVKTASEMKLYVNGVFQGSNPSTIALSRYQFGDTENESPIALVDEIVIYDRALSAAEIAAHFNAVPEPSSSALAAIGLLIVLVGGRSMLRKGKGIAGELAECRALNFQ
jgi:hypothetical protein